MHRRRFVTALGAGALSGVLLSQRAARGQDATPTPAGAISPVRWQLKQMTSQKGVKTPDHPENYWIQFLPAGKLVLKADCNSGRGSYQIAGSSLTLSELVSTKAACPPGSLGESLLSSLRYVVSFVLHGEVEDELILSMMADGGDLQFAPVLPGVVWQWVSLEVDGEETERAKDPSAYTLTFNEDGSVAVRADCNRGNGTAKVDGDKVRITAAITRMFCGEDSQDAIFLDAVDQARTFAIHDGTLRLTQADGKTVALFQPVAADT